MVLARFMAGCADCYRWMGSFLVNLESVDFIGHKQLPIINEYLLGAASFTFAMSATFSKHETCNL